MLGFFVSIIAKILMRLIREKIAMITANKTRILTVFIAIAMMLNGVFNIASGFSEILVSNLVHHLQDISQYSQYADVLQFRDASTLLSVFLGFLLLFLGISLFKGSYVAWLWALIFLSINAVNSLFPPVSITTFFISIIYLIFLYLCRGTFRKNRFSVAHYSRWVAFLTVIISLVYGVSGSYLLKAQFHGMSTWIDAIYFTLVTFSTLGYGDIYPVTANAKIFVCSMIVVGVSAFVATLSLVVAPLIQKRMEGVLSMMDKFHFKNHVMIYGYNALSRHLVKALSHANLDCLFITRSQVERQEIESAGFHAFMGNIHSREDLVSLGSRSAKYIIFVSDNDGDNILGAMAAGEGKCKEKEQNQNSPEKKLSGEPQIIVRIEQEINIEKAYQAGGDLVISASQLAGNNIAAKLLGKS
jgi:voltage-gated potassium channel